MFEEQQPVNNVLISAKQVASLTVTCTHHLCSSVFKLSVAFLDERVCGLSIRRSAAPLRQLSQIRFMLRLHLCQGPSLCLEWSPVCARNGTRRQVGAEVRV